MKTPLIVSLAILLVASPGCTVISSNSTTTQSGTKVSDETLVQLELGKTTKDWLIATLGAPTSATQVDEHTEILKYTSSRTTKQSGGLIVVLHANSETKEKETVYFEIHDGVLKRYWKADA